MARQVYPDKSKALCVDDGTTYAYVYIPATSSKPTYLLLHGWPSSSYDWRHQIKSLGDDGYGVLTPDLLGYGDTDKPLAVKEYSLKRMTGHVAQILKNEALEKVIGVGHDWGSGLLSYFVHYYPDVFSSLVFMSVPYMAPGPFDHSAVNAQTEQIFGYPVFGYWEFFKLAEAGNVCDKHLHSLRSLIYLNDFELQKTHFSPYGALKAWILADKTVDLPTWLTIEEFNTHHSIIAKGGFTSVLNWYKSSIQNVDGSADDVPPENKVVSQKVIFVPGDQDPITRQEAMYMVAEQGRKDGILPRVEFRTIESVGHWMMLEKPKEVHKILVQAGK